MTTRMHGIEFSNHAPVNCFEVIDGELAVDGHKISRIATRVGATPFYLYSRRAIKQRVSELRAVLPSDLRIHYAIKANPMPAVVSLLGSLVDGLDVASAHEMHVALDAGVSPGHISFAGPGKTSREIEQAVAAGITLNLESERQLDAALDAGGRLGVAPELAIRVNPDFELKASGMKMGGGPKAFGIDQERVADVAARVEAAGLKLKGFHIFCGSQILSAESLIDAQSKSFELGLRLSKGLARGIDWLNLGGGFGVPYFPSERQLDLARVAGQLFELCDRAHRFLGAPLVLELGRYLVAEAGVYVCRVLDRKVSQGQTFVVVDGGLHHHLAASGNFGQVIRKNYPVAVVNRLASVDTERQTIVGPLCTPLDLLADRMSLAKADLGDLVGVFRSGAYGPTASPAAFLSHPAATEILV